MDSQVLPPTSTDASSGNSTPPASRETAALSESAPLPQAPLGIRILLGPQGMRAGWSVALFGSFYFL
ncbi:MAG TPA: hypothetical protein VFU68_04200, partial [Terracidiphilus sp.]|nr:hypothetical protein [Terracidiphilus sp.]